MWVLFGNTHGREKGDEKGRRRDDEEVCIDFKDLAAATTVLR